MTINYKVFAAGDTLSANDLLTYIENQAVIQVDNEAELTTLNTTYPSVRVAFAQDTDKLYVNNDGVWEAVISGASPSLTNLTLTGNLTVQGSTTTIDSTTIAVKDKFIFEGATADAHETTLQVAEPTADRTITLPDATGTVALTSGLYALPSQTGNSGKYLKTDGTNETWSIDATSDLVTTAGDIVYGTAADTMARLGIGTANQVLRVNSGATAPEWATPSSGGITLLSTTSLSGASTTVSSIDQTYTNLYIIMYGFYSAGGNQFKIKPNATLNNVGNNVGGANGNISTLINDTNVQCPPVGTSTTAVDSVAILTVANYSDATMTKPLSWYGNATNGGSANFFGNGSFRITAAINAFVFALDSGTWGGGTIKVYGVK